MKRKRYTDEQIIAIVKQHEAGRKVAELARENGIGEGTIYAWRAKYGGMEVADAKRLRARACRPKEGRGAGDGGAPPERAPACKLMGMVRMSYRYEPRPDHNAEPREALVELARQKPRYGYRRLHAMLVRRGEGASPQRVYRLYRKEGLAVRRLRRKRIRRAAAAALARANQEWALDFVSDALANGRAGDPGADGD